jgi:hypothetical protein
VSSPTARLTRKVRVMSGLANGPSKLSRAIGILAVVLIIVAAIFLPGGSWFASHPFPITSLL